MTTPAPRWLSRNLLVLTAVSFTQDMASELLYPLLPLLITLICGAWCFVTLALLLAGTMRAEAVLAVANLLWVIFLGLGLLLPTSVLPGPAGTVAAWLPPGLLGDAARAASLDAAWPFGAWALLLAWGAVAAVLAQRTFRWSD